jgi:hypothetical protein
MQNPSISGSTSIVGVEKIQIKSTAAGAKAPAAFLCQGQM